MEAAGTTLFGKYLLHERISSGGKAEIWRATRQGGNRFVVIKRLRPSLAKDADLQAMFIREAKVAVQLSHPNIPQVFDLGLVNGDFYIELEHLPGANLRQILPRCPGPGVIPHDLAAFMAAGLCDALDHVHRKGGPTGEPLMLVHRDVAPDNCVLTYDGQIKLIDFSAATGMAPLGASPYLSPEQLHGAPVDRRSDVFSLSVILYEALSGRRLFASPATPLSRELHCCKPVLPLRAINPKIPSDLERIVMTGLEHDRSKRYQWASEMGAALCGYLVRHAENVNHATLKDFMDGLFAKEVAQHAAHLADLARRAPQPPPARVPDHDPVHASSGGFDFEIDESLMQHVVPNPEPAMEELTLPRGPAEDGPAPTILVPITLTPGGDPVVHAPVAKTDAHPAFAGPASSGPTEAVPGSEVASSKRRAQRWRIAVPVRGVWGSGGKLTNHFGASLVNLSTTGAKLKLDDAQPLAVGTQVGFTLPLKLHNMIALEGVIRRVVGREIGVEFVQPHPELLKLHRVK
ncbi:MAG: serine/threonine-protein kinase [Myxococcales bacterium]